MLTQLVAHRLCAFGLAYLVTNMRKLICFLGLFPLCSWGATGIGNNTGLAPAPWNGSVTISSPSTLSNITSGILATNQIWDSPVVTFSNGVDQVSGGAFPMLQPYGGGVYSGLRITNSSALSALREIAAMGFPLGATFPLGTYYYEFRDCVFWDGTIGGFGDAVLWKPSGTAGLTHYGYFYDCIFHAPNICFNLVQNAASVGYYEFKSCDFEAYGPGGGTGAGSVSLGFTPDQGPVTNILNGCRFTTKGSSLGVCILDQISAYTWVNGCHFNVVSTNANSENMVAAYSGEGNTLLVFNNCYTHYEGPGTNAFMDINIPGTFGAGNNCTLILNNCFHDGINNASGGWLLDTRAPGSGFNIIVIGGDYLPTHFTTTTNVTFINTPAEYVQTAKSANYAIVNSDAGSLLLVNGALSATLPTAVGIKGKQFTIQCATAGTNAILTTGGQTFLGPKGNVGATLWTNSAVGNSTTVVSDGANWKVLKTDF